MNKEILERYAGGADAVAKAIAGLKPSFFTAPTSLGGWTIGQIVIHLMDSDLIASDRMKRVIAEDNPTIIGYNEAAFARKLFYEKLDYTVAADIFKKNRELTAVILRNLPPEAFERFGTHNQRGTTTLAEMVEGYADHLEHHLGFLRRKRELLEKQA